MEVGIIKQINIDVEMQASYLDYAMSVIVARALPDVRDGLKPVHRRILYAMYDLGLTPDKPYKKSARIVGEVLGKYHPHGDAAVYEAMVRMAQSFSLRYPLVDGQGNFGSIDGDNAAAMRYTEARLAKIAMEMLNDIDKDTVDWTDNFDGTLKEPTVLPAALPNLLVNGSSGIAVGMSTSIPPHNLDEVVDALCHLIDNYDRREDVTVEDLMKFIPGPDFPTGGIIYRMSEQAGESGEQEDVIAKAYASGRGSIVMQAKAHIEEMSRNRSRIIVTELPYQANKANLIERIAELVRDGRIEGITDLRDESDRTGMRVIIEMTRTVEPMKVLGDLYKLTPLQQTFGVSLLALVDGEPRLLSLKYLLLHFLEHRQQVIVRRAKHDLAKAKQRAHILEGLLKALDILDEVIALIRGSRTADVAREGLKKQFGFSEIQAQAILDMQLRRLAALERKKLQDEYKEVLALIKELEALLASPKKVLALIRQNLQDLKTTYGDHRRTQIADRARGVLTTHDVVPEQNVTIALRADGMVVSVPDGNAPAKAGGPGQWLVEVLSTSARDDLYLFSATGKVTRIGAHQVPQAGAHHANLGGLSRGERIVAMLALPKVNGEPLEGNLLLATAKGDVKRAALADVASAAHMHPTVIRVADDDELIWAGTSTGGMEFLLFTALGQAIRFKEDEVRPQGLAAGGMGGIKLKDGDRVVAACAVPAETGKLEAAVISVEGYTRRTPLAQFPTQGRNGQGVQAKLQRIAGHVAGAVLAGPETNAVAAILAGGGTKRLPLTAFAAGKRDGAGKLVVATVAGDTVVRLITLPPGTAPAAEPKTRAPKDGADGTATRATRGSKPASSPPGAAASNKVSGKPGADAKAKSQPAASTGARPPEQPAGQAPAAAAMGTAERARSASGKTEKSRPAAPKSTAGPAKPEAQVKSPTPAPGKTVKAKASTTAARGKAEGATPAKPTTKPAAPETPNLFGPLPATSASTANERPVDRSTQPAHPTRPRGTPEAGTIARPPATGQLPLVTPDDEEPPAKPKRGAKKP